MRTIAAMATQQHSENPIHRFFTHFSGPIIWALEIAAVLLIIADHSTDFVDAVVVADLVIIVLMMAFRSALGLWKDSHHTGTLEKKTKTSVDDRGKRAITPETIVHTEHFL